MSIILGIDPGTRESGFVIYDSKSRKFLEFDIWPNEKLMWHLDYHDNGWNFRHSAIQFFVIEKISNQGMPAVGDDIFETAYWSGIFAQTIGLTLVSRIPAVQVRMTICGSTRAKKTNIITALVDRFDPDREFGKYGKGVKKGPGPFFGFKEHIWSAAALAITFAEVNLTENPL